MGITSELTENDTTLVIQVDDKFDFGKVQAFRDAYDKLPDQVKVIEVDLSQTEYMDSSALGMLLNMQKTLCDRQIDYKITHCRAQVSRILKISRFDKKFIIV